MMVSSAGSFVFAWLGYGLVETFKRPITTQAGADDYDHVHAISYAFGSFGLILFASQFIGSFLLFMPPSVSSTTAGGTPPAKPMTTREILSHYQFWLIMFMFFADTMPLLGVLSVLSSLVQSQFVGVTPFMGANYLAVINIVGATMRLFIGMAADKIGAKYLFTAAYVIQAIVFAVLPTVGVYHSDLSIFVGLLFPAKVGPHSVCCIHCVC